MIISIFSLKTVLNGVNSLKGFLPAVETWISPGACPAVIEGPAVSITKWSK
ncbi:MAG TPA: hypothetical protein VGA95_11530 [Thermodesulfobacteriota bacterium]